MALTAICNNVNSGGAVSVFASDSFTALTDGELYLFEAAIITTGAGGTVKLYVNSDSTDANYSAGYILSGSNPASGNTPVSATPDAASNITVISGYLGVLNGKPWMIAEVVDQGSTARATKFGVLNTSESSITQLRLSASGAIIADGSYIKIWSPTGLSTIADSTVSGGAVSSHTTGAFSALTEGKIYAFYIGTISAAGGTLRTINTYINGATTDSDYRRGIIFSGITGSSGDAEDSNGSGVSVQANGDIGVEVGTIGIFNGTPHICSTAIYQRTGDAVYYVSAHFSVWHTTETDFDELQSTVVGGASAIANDSRILIKEFA